ncbi:hypothetical protein BC831DRAFT_473883 [Entophlyctis helioformis]|nr:hypothetical protein BC831DRAFT_473883 [Entophlyctis helioformis]
MASAVSMPASASVSASASASASAFTSASASASTSAGPALSPARPVDLAALKDTVSDALAKRGVLASLKAQLRAAVFTTLNDATPSAAPSVAAQRTASLAATEKGRLALDMVREFLQFCRLEQTLSVFNPESGCADTRVDPFALQRQAGIQLHDGHHAGTAPSRPVLLALLESRASHDHHSSAQPRSSLSLIPQSTSAAVSAPSTHPSAPPSTSSSAAQPNQPVNVPAPSPAPHSQSSPAPASTAAAPAAAGPSIAQPGSSLLGSLPPPSSLSKPGLLGSLPPPPSSKPSLLPIPASAASSVFSKPAPSTSHTDTTPVSLIHHDQQATPLAAPVPSVSPKAAPAAFSPKSSKNLDDELDDLLGLGDSKEKHGIATQGSLEGRRSSTGGAGRRHSRSNAYDEAETDLELGSSTPHVQAGGSSLHNDELVARQSTVSSSAALAPAPASAPAPAHVPAPAPAPAVPLAPLAKPAAVKTIADEIEEDIDEYIEDFEDHDEKLMNGNAKSQTDEEVCLFRRVARAWKSWQLTQPTNLAMLRPNANAVSPTMQPATAA